jgi:hypothetical protein
MSLLSLSVCTLPMHVLALQTGSGWKQGYEIVPRVHKTDGQKFVKQCFFQMDIFWFALHQLPGESAGAIA